MSRSTSQSSLKKEHVFLISERATINLPGNVCSCSNLDSLRRPKPLGKSSCWRAGVQPRLQLSISTIDQFVYRLRLLDGKVKQGGAKSSFRLSSVPLSLAGLSESLSESWVLKGPSPHSRCKGRVERHTDRNGVLQELLDRLCPSLACLWRDF